MSELEDWILSSTGNVLGGETLDFGSAPSWEGVDKRAAFRQQFTAATGLQYDVPTQEISNAQIAAQQKFFSDYGLGNSSAYNVENVYNLGSTEANLTAMGYAPPTVDRRAEMEKLYGSNFTDQQIEGALTNRYGEVQNLEMGEGWKSLYQTFNKWEQEDELFRTEMLGLQDEIFPAAEAQQRAMMASGGMETGSDQWKRNIQKIQDQRIDVDAEVAERRNALEDTSIYKTLMSEYENMRGVEEMRGITKTRTAYQDIQKYVEATSKYTGPRYGYDSETGGQILIREGYWTDVPAHYVTESKPYEQEYFEGTATGKLLFGAGEDRTEQASFDEFYQSQFGLAENVGNPYESVGVSNQEESAEDRQARRAASGMAME